MTSTEVAQGPVSMQLTFVIRKDPKLIFQVSVSPRSPIERHQLGASTA